MVAAGIGLDVIKVEMKIKKRHLCTYMFYCLSQMNIFFFFFFFSRLSFAPVVLSHRLGESE